MSLFSSFFGTVFACDRVRYGALLVLGAVLWTGLYVYLEPLANFLVASLPLDQTAHTAEALRFFFYDTPKVLMLLFLISFVMGVVRSFVSPEKTRALLAGKRVWGGHLIAASFGVVTPFCSCSALPLFIGFVGAGVPLGVTFSFLIAAPMVNEIALILLWGLLGWKVALIYISFGFTLAVVGGWIIGRLPFLERYLEEWVRDLRVSPPAQAEQNRFSLRERISKGLESANTMIREIWVWILAGIAIGAVIHGFVPTSALMSVMGKDAWWNIPAAVLAGVPIYSNAAGVIPVVEALLGKGAALGTVLAFMMSITALSLPEMIILRKVLRWPLIAGFIATVTLGIIGVGLLFNLLF